jgi:hypothetical protein
MLKLKPLDKDKKNEHYKLLKARFDKKLKSAVAGLAAGEKYDVALIAHLKSNVNDILIGTPEQIAAIAAEVVAKYADFSAYAVKRGKDKHPDHSVHKNTLAVIEECFDYKWFSNQMETWGAYHLVAAYGLRICPYCQANHINFHVEPVRTRKGTEFKMRPPLDHYLPKSIYPYLAVSLSNLIPSCAQCNSGVKAADNPLGRVLAHPLDAKKLAIGFSAVGSLTNTLNGKLKIEDIAIELATTDTESANHAIDFRLEERYQWYRHEVKDLFDRHEEHRDFYGALNTYIPREMYVLGFLESQAEQRAIGLCLRDIYRELKP